MGWKNIKEHYQIGHIVQITEEGLCIGTGYIHDLIVVGLDGVITKRYDGGGNEELCRYQRELDADPARARELLEAPDIFDNPITVYTYDGGEILEKQCLNLGWPNVTLDGQIMYTNRFSEDKAVVVDWAKRNADSGIKHCAEAVVEATRRLAEYQARLAQERANREQLEAAYPTLATVGDKAAA